MQGAGIPNIIVPHAADQPFWGQRVHVLGAGPRPIPVKKLTTSRLLAALADGKFLGLVGEVGVLRFSRAGGTAASCSNITVAVSLDGKRVFVQDVTKNVIRVLLKDGAAAEGAKAAEPTD